MLMVIMQNLIPSQFAGSHNYGRTENTLSEHFPTLSLNCLPLNVFIPSHCFA